MTLKELATEELRRSLSTQDFVISVLRTAILTSVFAPGATLRQADLAEQLGVSHIPVREAIRSLASQGLVTLYPHRGAVVSRLSPEEAEEIFAIRLFLESGALKTAIPNMTPRAIFEAEHVLDATDMEKNPTVWSDLNWRFHSLLYAPSGFPRLVSMIGEMHANVYRYLRLYIGDLNYQPDSQREHRELLDACRERATERALAILETHITNAKDHLVAYLREQTTGAGN